MNEMIPKIFDKLSTVAEAQAGMSQKLDDAIFRWDSWKDGQTAFMHKTTEDISSINAIIKPLQDDLLERIERQKEEGTGWKSVKFGVIQMLLIATTVALIMNAPSLWKAFTNSISIK